MPLLWANLLNHDNYWAFVQFESKSEMLNVEVFFSVACVKNTWIENVKKNKKTWVIVLPAVKRRQICTWNCQRSIQGEDRGWQWRGRSTPKRWCQWQPGLLHRERTTCSASGERSAAQLFIYVVADVVLGKYHIDSLLILDKKEKHLTTRNTSNHQCTILPSD